MSISPRVALLSILLTALVLHSGQVAIAATSSNNKSALRNKCSMALAPGQLGTLKSEFLARHNTYYSKVVDHAPQILSQCSLGVCTVFTSISVIESRYYDKTRREISISEDHLAFEHWIARAVETLDDPDIHKPVDLGSYVWVAYERMLEFGIVPSDQWPYSSEFKRFSGSQRIHEALQNLIVRTKMEIKNAPNRKQKDELKALGKRRIRELMESFIGGPAPKSVEVTDSMRRSVKLSPREYAQQIFSELNQPFQVFTVAKFAADQKSFPRHLPTEAYKVSAEDISEVARRALDQGLHVGLTFWQYHPFIDDRTGIMSIEAFHYPQWAKPLPLDQRLDHVPGSSTHEVHLVGYDLDPATGKVQKWKIKNSHGSQEYDGGYGHMYADYFREYAVEVSFFNDQKVDLSGIKKHKVFSNVKAKTR